MTMAASPTNEAVGELLGVSHVAVSRWRSGTRIPSPDNMEALRRVYGWSLDDQFDARNTGKYATELCKILDRGPATK
jgi:transcriptional regulator with XRE-family HTH domain